MARPNREILTGGKRYKEAKKLRNRVDEVVFDKDKRKDYLTGFHKRKLERKKKAQDYLEEQSKKERLEERARIREERKAQVQQKLAEMKEAMELNPFLDKDNSSSEEEQNDDEKDEDEEEGEKGTGNDDEDNDDESDKEGVKFDDEQNEKWSGFDENNEAKPTKKMKAKGILKKQIYEVDNEDAPVTGVSEVVIESLDNPNKFDLSSVTKNMNVDLSKANEVLHSSIVRAKKYARIMGMSDTPAESDKVVKPKKKKFRYLSKTERKVKNLKEKSKSFKRKKKD